MKVEGYDMNTSGWRTESVENRDTLRLIEGAHSCLRAGARGGSKYEGWRLYGLDIHACSGYAFTVANHATAGRSASALPRGLRPHCNSGSHYCKISCYDRT